MVNHELPPIYDENSKALILGSMPSVKSRSDKKYYAHPQNRFWRVLEGVFGDSVGDDWKNYVLKHHIALWDVIASCDIVGSSDVSIKNVVPNDIKWLLSITKIEHIFVLGKKAFNLYNKYIYPIIGVDAIYLPSTSLANARVKLDELIEEFSLIKEVSQ